jgi:hypothetical protein
MKKLLVFVLFLMSASARAADLPTWSGWPQCVPILGFSPDAVGVAALETFTRPKPAQRWVCLAIDRATLIATPIDEKEFDTRFPNVRAIGNHGDNDCQEMTRTPAQPVDSGQTVQPTCIDTKVLCEGSREIPIKVPAAVESARCLGRVFASASVIDGRVWAAVNPLDVYYREVDGSGIVVQSMDGKSVLGRRASVDVGGRSVCAMRKDPVTGHIWLTTETGLAELRDDGAVVRLMRFRATGQPMQTVQKKS